jgi:signal transduction histidine kinase
VLSVIDDGSGLPKAASDGDGMGLENMNYRARAIGARLQFTARNKGGMMMRCIIPQRESRLK